MSSAPPGPRGRAGGTAQHGWWDGQRPVVVLGMHRSGTSLVSRVLRGFGIEMGRVTDNSDESLYFQQLNRWILRELPGGWDHPLAAAEALADPAVVAELASVVREQLASSWTATHFFPHRRPTDPDSWGWKDPRTTITMPVWAEVFPRHRAIWVVRNGAAVAASLLTRRERSRNGVPGRRRQLLARVSGPSRPGPSLQLRCRTLDDAFAIWEEYHSLMDDPARTQGVHTVRYEDLVTDPEPVLASMVAFLGDIEPEAVRKGMEAARAEVDPALATAFRSDPATRRLELEKADELAARGYPPG